MAAKKFIKALVIEPEKQPYVTRVENSLEYFQKKVGGYIECVSLTHDVKAIINEEGKLEGLAPNIHLGYDVIVGTAVIVGVDGEDFGDFDVSMLQRMPTLHLIGKRSEVK